MTVGGTSIEAYAGDETTAGQAETSAYTGAAQELSFTVDMGAYAGSTDDVQIILTDGKSNLDYEVVWTIGDEGDVHGIITASATNAGTYTLSVRALGMTADTVEWTINQASIKDVDIELTSSSYEQGRLPELKSAQLDVAGVDEPVDVTEAIKADIAAGNIELKFSKGGYWSTDTNTLGNDYKGWLHVVADNGNYGYSGNLVDDANVGEMVPFEVVKTSAASEAFAQATALEGMDQDGKVVKADEKGAFSVVAIAGKDVYVVPTSVMPKGGDNAVEVELAKEGGINANLYTKSGSTYTLVSGGTNVQDPGKYYVSVVAKDADSVYAGQVCYVPLTVQAYSFDKVVVFNADADNSGYEDDGTGTEPKADVDATSFVFDNDAQHIAFAVDGEIATLDSGSLKVYDSKGDLVFDGDTKDDEKAYSAAGTYTAYATIGGLPIQADFTVEKLDLSSAVVVAEDVALDTFNYDSFNAKVKVNNKTVNALNSGVVESLFDIVYAVSPAVTKVGTYKVTLSAAQNDPNVTGTKTVEFNVVDEVLEENPGTKCYVTYNGRDWDDNDGSDWKVESFKATGTGTFDADLVGLNDDDLDYTVSVIDKETGEEVTGDLAANKTYTVVVRVVPNSDYEFGGTFQRDFTVEDGSFAADDVTFKYKGDVVSSDKVLSVDYTGENVMDDIKVAVADGKKTLTEGTHYELVLKNDKGEVVDEAVESGPYTLTVKGLTYIGSVDLRIQVGAMDVTKLRVQPSDMGVVAWTGEAVTPVIEYTLDSQAKIDAKTAKWHVLPADYYVAKYFDEDGELISEAVDEGKYTAVITPSTKIENMTLPAENVLEFAVSKTVAGFVDVSTSAWYANVVAKANTLEYMTGISGTAMFAPNATITRAEVAEVFAKMAGLELDKDKTYPTKFADVASDAWFAQSVAWASQAGIVGGYEGTDLFGSFDNATREQVATMIYRYAAVAGLDTSVEDEAKALASYKDAGQLTFGKTAMAWCVEQGIMGVDTDSLNPLANMSRAEMAATAVRVQPEAIA